MDRRENVEIVSAKLENLPESEPAVAVGTYYRAIEGDEWIGLSRGDLALVIKIADGTVHLVSAGNQFGVSIAEFLAKFEPAPDGAEERQAEIARLMHEISEGQLSAFSIERDMATFAPQLIEAGSDGEMDASTAGTAVVAVGSPASLEAAKRQVAHARNQVAKFQKSLLATQERLMALVQEQQALIQARVDSLSSMVQAAEEMIFTLNLYGGKNERIVQLRRGAPASADEPIAIRQLVLYMDEESAIAAEQGGIDVSQIEEFDRWVLEPAHLEQVLPEPKGVVALKARRSRKDYNDPWVNAVMGEANKHTYWLMRNGENLYRIDSDLEVGETVLPLENEFEELFWETRYDPQERKHVRQPLDPGSRSYSEALKRADAKKRHYLRVALFLQGLLDRTRIFHPLPAPRINILDPRNQERYLRLIFDAEPRKHLGTGRPSFDEWLKEINSKLDVGHRIIGCFHMSPYGITSENDRRNRLSPSWRIPLPSDKELHTIARKEGDALIIYYDRGEVWRLDEGYQPAMRRASCKLYRTDRCFLNFDVATVEDMKYYLGSRLNRHAYMYMVPVLKRAIRMKEEEVRQEAPFRDLLTGEIMKRYGVDEAEARSAVAELVPWWKFKNLEHRALTSDDAKALRMIVEEFGHRQAREVERAHLDYDDVVATIRAAEPDVIYIGHKKGSRFVALIAHDPVENVFVREQEWSRGRGGCRLVSEMPWRTVDQRRHRWDTCWTSDRWADWKKDVRPREYLTGPERDMLLAELPKLVQVTVERFAHRYSEYDKGEPCNRLIAVVLDEKHNVYAFLQATHAHVPERLFSDSIANPKFARIRIYWERTRDGVRFFSNDYTHLTFHRYWDDDDNEWGYGGTGRRALLYFDQEALDAFLAESKQSRAAERLKRRLWHAYAAILHSVSNRLLADFLTEEYRKFVAEYGDPDLWEDHKKTIRISNTPLDFMPRVAACLIENRINPHGMTVRELIERARAFGVSPNEGDRDVAILPLDHVIEMSDGLWPFEDDGDGV